MNRAAQACLKHRISSGRKIQSKTHVYPAGYPHSARPRSTLCRTGQDRCFPGRPLIRFFPRERSAVGPRGRRQTVNRRPSFSAARLCRATRRDRRCDPSRPDGWDDPAALVLHAERHPREYLMPKEVDRLIAAARENRHGHRDAAMILVADHHGLRVSELRALRWAQARPSGRPSKPNRPAAMTHARVAQDESARLAAGACTGMALIGRRPPVHLCYHRTCA